VPRLEDLARREGRAADHALDVLGDRLLVAHAVLHRATAPSANAWAVARSPRAVCMHLVATMPKSQGAARPRRGRAQPPDDVARAREPQPVSVDRSTCAVEVVGPHLDVVELREVRREQRPDRAAADDRRPSRVDVLRAFTSR
jgi:hypothetical protein